MDDVVVDSARRRHRIALDDSAFMPMPGAVVTACHLVIIPPAREVELEDTTPCPGCYQ